jgi:putative oxidoreductase
MHLSAHSAPLNPALSKPWLQKSIAVGSWGTRALDALQPVAKLAARLYVANVFFSSGLTKIRDWDTTLALFMDEYKVPLLSPDVAAVMGTAGELGLPVLLALGLGSRFAALGLSVVNVMAVLSLSDIAPAALQQHILWGTLLVGVAVFGPGGLALDRWIQKFIFKPL